MNTNLKFSLAKMTGLIMIIMLAITSNAQPGADQGNGPGTGIHRGGNRGDSTKMDRKEKPFLKIPELTKEQEKKIKQTGLKFRKEAKNFRNQIAEKRAHLKTLSEADKANQVEIEKTIDELTAIQGQLMKKKSQMEQEIRSMLTDDQRLFFDRHKGEKNKKGPGRKMGKGKKHGSRGPGPMGEEGPMK